MALVIAMVMIISAMSLTAFAADDNTLTINNTQKDHEYTAYQIFKGSKADKTQVTYTAASGYVEGTTYYYKNGADYDVIAIADAEAYGAASASQTLYVRTGDSALGDTVWGSGITTAGKKALYTAYGMTVADADLDKAANIIALTEKIADEDNTTSSESDKAVKFANVFYQTNADGTVTAKGEYLTGGTTIKSQTEGSSITFENCLYSFSERSFRYIFFSIQ